MAGGDGRRAGRDERDAGCSDGGASESVPSDRKEGAVLLRLSGTACVASAGTDRMDREEDATAGLGHACRADRALEEDMARGYLV